MNRNEIAKFLVETCNAKQYEDHFKLTWSNSDSTRRQAVFVFIHDTHVIIESPIVPVEQIDADRVLKAAAQEESPFGIALGGKGLELYILRTMLPFDDLNPDILNRTSLLLAKNADLLEKEVSRFVMKDMRCQNCHRRIWKISSTCPGCGFFDRWSGRVVGPPPPLDEDFPDLKT